MDGCWGFEPATIHHIRLDQLLSRLRIFYNTSSMALGTQNILVACVANLVALLPVLIGVGKQHIWRVRQVVAYSIVTKSLPVALETILLFGLTDAPVLDRPTEAGVRGWR